MNPVVVDLLHIRALHSRHFFLNPLVFYHPGVENRMADDKSRLFDLFDTPFLSHIFVTYTQLHISWKLCPLPPQLLSCVTSKLLSNPCKQGLHRIRAKQRLYQQWSYL